MKQKIFLLLIISAYFWNPVLAQDKVFEKGFTLKTAYITPIGNFGNFTQKPFRFALKESRWGLGLQLGTMYFLNDINIGEDMRIGIDVTWMSFNGQSSVFNYRDTINGYPKQGTFNLYYFYFSPEFGPMFSFSPVENMAFDVSFKISPGFGFSRGVYNPDVYESRGITGAGYGIRYTPAFYFRYTVLLVGIETNLGNYRYSFDGTALDGTYRESTPFSTIRYVIGFKF